MRCEVLEDTFVNDVLDILSRCDEQEYTYFNSYSITVMKRAYREWLLQEKMIF